ncbi:MAG: hypothetical protein QOF78_1398 [Phycisphaerales bacterium]|nr:hypothetical protein [Phycisphaerales bacterium]
MSTPIIDYASPASRASLRLPTRSEIYWDETGGRLRITQVLAGRGDAVMALALAAFTFLIMSLAMRSMLAKWHRNLGEIAIFAAFMAAEAIIGALVVNNTWRRTRLTVTPEEMTLVLSSPFGSRQRFVFRNEQIEAVRVVDREPLPGTAIVAELEICMWSMPAVRLFAGQPRNTLMSIARAISTVQPSQSAPPPPATVRGAGAREADDA